MYSTTEDEQTFSVTNQIVNVLSAVVYMVSVATTQFGHSNIKEAMLKGKLWSMAVFQENFIHTDTWILI